MDPTSRRELKNAVRTAADPAVGRNGCELVAVELGSVPGRLVVRLVVDRPGGVTLDTCAAVSRAASPALDAAGLDARLGGPWVLEVASPGVERPIELLRDYERFEGRPARVKLVAGAPRKKLKGTLRGLDGDRLRIEVAGAIELVPLDQIERTRLVEITDPLVGGSP